MPRFPAKWLAYWFDKPGEKAMSTGSKLIVAAAIVSVLLRLSLKRLTGLTVLATRCRLTMTVKADCTPVSQPQQPSEKPKDND